MPGIWSASSISAISVSQVNPGRHWSRGLSTTVTSAMLSGAGSVAVEARPIFPNALSTSGKALNVRSMICTTRLASVTLMPGGAVGM